MPLWWDTFFDLEFKGTYESKIGELHVDRKHVANLKGEFDASISVGYSILWFGSQNNHLIMQVTARLDPRGKEVEGRGLQEFPMYNRVPSLGTSVIESNSVYSLYLPS